MKALYRPSDDRDFYDGGGAGYGGADRGARFRNDCYVVTNHAQASFQKNTFLITRLGKGRWMDTCRGGSLMGVSVSK